MILSIPLSAYNKQFIIFLQPVKNNMMDHGTFIRILYSTTNTTFNGIFIHIQKETTQDICAIEKDVLKAYITTKHPIYSIEKQVGRHPSKKILKISGIWENDTSYGLAYKILE
jgi:hypothetical protein